MIDGEPMVYDLDLAGALGYKNPPQIRQLLKRLNGAGSLPKGDFFTDREDPGIGRPAVSFYLGEKAALKVVTKSETPKADAITDQVIEVVIRARKGQLPEDKGF